MKRYFFSPYFTYTPGTLGSRAYQDFHSRASNVMVKDDCVVVDASNDYIQEVFNQRYPDWSGLCQQYYLVNSHPL